MQMRLAVVDSVRRYLRDIPGTFAMAHAKVDLAIGLVAAALHLPRDAVWRDLLDKTGSFTIVDRRRRVNLLRLARNLNRDAVPGVFVECGVFRGGTAALLGQVRGDGDPGRDVWLFDSFEGLPQPAPLDGARAAFVAGNRAEGRLESIGVNVGSLEEVQHLLLDRFEIPVQRLHFVKGWFQDTLSQYQGGPIALLHIDADWYESIKVCLQHLWPSVAVGGYVVIDDYGHFKGARAAVDEFLASLAPPPVLQRKGYSQAYFRKVG